MQSDLPTSERSLRGIFGEARTKILLWYAGVFLALGLLAIPTFRWLLFRRVDARVRADLVEQVEDFRAILEQENRNVPVAIDRFIAETQPEDDNFFLIFRGDRFYASIPRALPAELQPDAELTQALLALEQEEIVLGQKPSGDPDLQELLYVVKPIHAAEGEIVGTVLAVHASGGERSEALDGVILFAEFVALSTLVAFALSWLVSGRVLAPVRELTTTAREIGEAGLDRRLLVRGRGELAELAQTFNAMLDRLQKIIVSQRNFISDAGHELRTPVTIVRGHLELMGDDPEEQREAVAIAMEELDRIARMVEEMSLLAKSERADFVRPVFTQLSDFTNSLYAKAKTLGDREWQLTAVAREAAWIDPQRLTEAIVNLVQNAVEHTKPGDTIAIGSSADADSIKFWVRDTGPGVAPEHQQRIFDRFVRIDKPTTVGSGAGLGLAIVSVIAAAHGGRVDLLSPPGAGATFEVVIPRNRTANSLVQKAPV